MTPGGVGRAARGMRSRGSGMGGRGSAGVGGPVGGRGEPLRPGRGVWGKPVGRAWGLKKSLMIAQTAASKPEVHSPDQERLDLAKYRLFPNRAFQLPDTSNAVPTTLSGHATRVGSRLEGTQEHREHTRTLLRIPWTRRRTERANEERLIESKTCTDSPCSRSNLSLGLAVTGRIPVNVATGQLQH